MSEDCDLEAVAAILDDEVARRILTETSTRPMSANELSDCCDVSTPTVYRRLEDLKRCDLVEESTRPDPDGHHHHVYRARLDRITIDLVDGRLEVSIDREEDIADRFTRLIEDI